MNAQNFQVLALVLINIIGIFLIWLFVLSTIAS